MRALKILVLIIVLTTVLLGASLAWLVRSEAGSRWLLEQGLQLAPINIEATGVTGNLADGLAVDSLSIAFPTAEVLVSQIVVSWNPVSLLACVVHIDNAHIAELSVAVVPNESTTEPPADRLFWLQLPLEVQVAAGQIDKLRIQAAQFVDVGLVGGLGHQARLQEKVPAG